MSCEELATFFANLADIPYIRQNHSTFELVATKNKKVISNNLIFRPLENYKPDLMWPNGYCNFIL